LTLPVPSALGQMVAQFFTVQAYTTDYQMTGYNQTTRFTYAEAGTNGIIMGDAPGAPAVNFTATDGSGNNQSWVGMGVPLL
jgi:hypothetical protein